MLYGKEHVERYQATGGAEGHDWRGTVTLLLTTTGRKSGQARVKPLIYQRHGDEYLVVASNGGGETPAWYLNLLADPVVKVQVLDDVFEARARTATPEEHPDLWKIMAAVWPGYDDYQAKTEREIPVVVLERV